MLKRFTKTLVFVLLLGACALAQGLTPKDLARLKIASGAELSPDGKRIAYSVSVQRDLEDDEFKNGAAFRELHLMDLNGNSRPFIVGDVNINSVHFSRDGKELTYLAKRPGDKKTTLYAIPVDGGESRKILTFSEGISSYSMSPDGQRIAFIATEPKDKTKEKWSKKGFNQEVVEEEYRFPRVYVARREQNTKDLKPLELEGSASELHWSPAGDRLLVALAPNPGVDAFYMYRKMHVVDTSGRVICKIDNPGKLGRAAFSPDGKSVAFLSGVDINDPHNGHLMLADASTGAFKDLTPDIKGEVDDFAFASNTEISAVASFGAGSARLDISTGGGMSRHKNPAGLNYTHVSAAAGKAVLLADSAAFPSEVFFEDKRLTKLNPWLSGRSLAKQEVITHQAKDGLELEGILIHPLNEVAGQRYPLILTVHGGPESHYNNGWLSYYSTPGQVAAARGYAVFYPNYRGSTGRGVEFAKLSQGDPAGKEFDDLVDAVDHLVNMGLVDTKKVGITGGSYGGYASAWGATYFTERFAASVMFVGISDKISKVGTTDIPDEEFLVHARKRPWDDFAFFLERSPIRYVKQAKTPILIMHGKNDPRVHPTQSMELFRFLKSLAQTPVRLVLYPGEGHGNRKAAARYDYSLRLLRWMDHYLKGPGGDPPPVELDYDLAEPKQ